MLWLFSGKPGLMPFAITEHLNTGNSSELATAMEVGTSAGSATKYVLYSQMLSAVNQGEVVFALADFEVTNDLGINVAVFSQLILAASASALSGSEISEANGRNVTPDMHHDVHARFGTLAAAANLGTRYVNVVAYAASTQAQPGAVITVEQDYGRLIVMKLAPA